MAAQITTLCEGLIALLTNKWSLTCMLSKMISEIAGLLEYRVAVWVHALEVQLYSLCVGVANLDCLMPFSRHSFKRLRIALLIGHNAFRLLIFNELLHITIDFAFASFVLDMVRRVHTRLIVHQKHLVKLVQVVVFTWS